MPGAASHPQGTSPQAMAAAIAAMNTANPAASPPEDLQRLLMQAQLFLLALRDGYDTCRSDPTLRNRYETAGKAVKRVLFALEGKAAGGLQ